MSEETAVELSDVLAAQERTRGHVRRTPMLRAEPGSGGEVWFKAEFLQRCGVFKTRGAFNRQLAAREAGELDARVGVVAASGGNAGLANAFAARALGVPATVFVPASAPQVKVDRLHAYGATVHQVGREYAEAFEAAQTHAEVSGALFCHAYDQPEIAAGAGVIALEAIEDLPDVDTIVVSVGGGGLFAGVAAAVESRGIRIVAVEPDRAPTLHAAIDAGRPVDVTVGGIAADSLGARRLGRVAFDLARRVEPTSVLVDDDAIVIARDRLWDEYRIPAEHGAATAFAALTSGAYLPSPTERIVVVICGANTDVTTLGAATPRSA